MRARDYPGGRYRAAQVTPSRTLPVERTFDALYGLEVLEIGAERARGRVAVRDEVRQPFGLVHGGVASLLLDGAMGRAIVRTLAEGEMCATVHLSVQFLAAAPLTTMRAEGRVVKRGRSVAFLEGEVVGDDGTLVARATGTWAIASKKR